ncbi:MAG TPA: type I methionyl aminopeptidase [Eubacterium sp.]|nr:type I methionyl aminopeptidase [Eubacterium sp.]
MAVTIKSEREIELMREAGRVLALVHEELGKLAVPGAVTSDIDKAAEEMIRSYGCIPSFKGYDGFPASVCVSINDEVVHGIPSKKKILRDGDIVTFDCGTIYKGYQSDAARTHLVGNVKPEVKLLVERTKEAFYVGLEKARAGHYLHEIGNAIDDFITPFGYGIVEALVGHGIGTDMHEDPAVPNYRVKGKGMKLCAGMTICIEPMINLGTYEVDFSEEDGWTCTTADHLPSAHYENTILITDGDPEILSIVK